MTNKKKRIIDVMLDIETLSTKVNPVIPQISAVSFDIKTGKLLGEEFDKMVNPMSCVQAGLEIDSSTVKWWMGDEDTEDAVRAIIGRSIMEGEDLKKVLESFSKWIKILEEKYNAKVCIWGNGASFDCVRLMEAYNTVKLKAPWKFFQERDVRTIVDLGERIYHISPKKTMKFTGVKHNAIDDCKHQIKYCYKVIQTMKKGARLIK